MADAFPLEVDAFAPEADELVGDGPETMVVPLLITGDVLLLAESPGALTQYTRLLATV